MSHKIKKVTAVVIAGILALALMAGCSPESAPAAGQNTYAAQVRVDGGYIQWRASEEAEWENLISVDELRGAAGVPGATGEPGPTGAAGAQGYAGDTGDTGATGAAGTDGREIEVQSNGTYIQWRYVGDGAWINLTALSSLMGAQGETGATGAAGAQGIQGITGSARRGGSNGRVRAAG